MYCYIGVLEGRPHLLYANFWAATSQGSKPGDVFRGTNLRNLPEGSATVGIIYVFGKDEALSEDGALNNDIALLIRYGVFEYAAVEYVIKRGSTHDQGRNLTDQSIIIPVGKVYCLDRGYDTVCHGDEMGANID